MEPVQLKKFYDPAGTCIQIYITSTKPGPTETAAKIYSQTFVSGHL